MVAIGFGLAMIAQDGKNCYRPPHAIQDGMTNPNKVVSANGTQKNVNPDALNVTACDTTGHAGNAYGSYTRGSRSLLYFDPNLNTLIYTHRSAPTIDATANTGHIMFDQSTDGGLTWTMQRGPVYTPGAELARYPQGFIYNPAANTNPANAFMSGYGPCTNGTGWLAHWAAAASLSGTLNPNQQVVMFVPGVFQALIPYNADVQQNGDVWISEMSYDGTDYMDTTFVIHGIWNNALMRHDYTNIKVKTNVNQDLNGLYNFAYAGVAFAPTGGTGYLTIMAHDDFTTYTDSAYYLIVRKTTDAGVTWGTPSRICLSNLDSLIGLGAGTVYTTGFDFDPIVDMNGNLHISVIGSPSSYPGAGWSVPTNSVKVALHVYTTNGGTIWKARKLGQTQTFRGNFGSTPIGEDNRPQISTNWTRDRLVFSWFDTDTIQFGNGGNIFPDHHMVAFNVTTGMYSTEMITTTGGTCADGITSFGSVPQYVSYNSGTIGVPLSYMVLINNDDLAVCQFRFGEGITLTDAQINQPANAIYLCIAGGMEEYNGLFTIGNPYPNPTSGATSLELNLTASSQVNAVITNAIGQTVMNVMDEKLAAGKHTLNIDASKFQTGIYFVTVNAGGYTVTKKLTVNK